MEEKGKKEKGYFVGSDIGGTFTDFVYLDKSTGEFCTEKTHSTPKDYSEGVIESIKKSKVKCDEIVNLVHGSTIIINTLCERKGSKIGLITTKGFRDILEITRSNRPDLYNLLYKKPPVFVERHLRLGVQERVDYHGKVLQPLSRSDVIDAVKYLESQNVCAIAVCFLHSYKNPAHEKQCGEIIREVCDLPVSLSHEICREWREYERTSTTVLNAYCLPVSVQYTSSLLRKLHEIGVDTTACNIMQSNGGTFSFKQAGRKPIQCCESGPVAGVIASAIIGKLIGEPNIISLDFGGTTTKASLIENGQTKITTDYFLGHDPKVAKYPIKVPTIDIVEIGSGGGSFAHLDVVGSLKVGPESQGADPGPACYGRGGDKVTVTDCNLVTGRLNKDYFCGGDVKIDSEKSWEAIRKLNAEYNRGISDIEFANGILSLADSNMVTCLKLVSVRRGYDPSNFTVVAFGGNGPVHASSLASYLNVKKIVVPLNPGVFSAFGMLLTDARRDLIRTNVTKLVDEETMRNVNNVFTEMGKDVTATLVEEEGIDSKSVSVVCQADIRYYGQEHTVKISLDESMKISEIQERFHEVHEKTFSFKIDGGAIEIVNYHVIGFATKEFKLKKIDNSNRSMEKARKGCRKVYYNEDGWVDAQIFERDLLPGNTDWIPGPCVIEERTATTVVYPSQRVKVDGYGFLHIEAKEVDEKMEEETVEEKKIALNPFVVDIMKESLLAIADEMFISTQRTSMSTIIYEVLDFAVGITDKIGRLVSQGNGVAMFISLLSFNVKYVVEKFEDNLYDGDLIILNDPYEGGGTHLSDVSVVAPVFYKGQLVAFVANKAHWTEVGGKVAGSWSTDATEVYQEGLRFTGLKIREKGIMNEGIVEIIRANVRTPDQTLGDMHAQIGSLNLAAKRIIELCDRYGVDVFVKTIEKIIGDSAEEAKKAFKTLPKKSVTEVDYIDDDGLQTSDIKVVCKVTIGEEKCEVDFEGTQGQVPGPVNCGRNATETGCRCLWQGISNKNLTSSNDGVFQNLDVKIPPKTLISCELPASVSTYWETLIFCSDVMWKAMSKIIPDRVSAGHFTSVCAVSAWGMHQDSGEIFILVEPLPGGWGAGTKKDGENGLVCIGDGETFIIPVEVCEKKYGVRVNRYEFYIPNDSSGAGEFRGGRGILREYEVVCDKMFLGTTFGRHKHAPWGMLEGNEGNTNFVKVIYKDPKKKSEVFGKCAGKALEKGDRIQLYTATGGGCGHRFKRDVNRVKKDVLNGFVTVQSAGKDYGVVIDPKTFDVIRETEERKEFNRKK